MHPDTEQILLAALVADVSDETAWLALADHLEESGQPDRAELVRLCRRLRGVPVLRRTRARAALEGRLAELLAAGVGPVVPERVNSVGMRFALIEPGRFRMGSPAGERTREGTEGPTREVEITRAFYLGVYQVTQGQFVGVMNYNPSHFCATGGGSKDVAGLDTTDFPVDSASWAEVVNFCRQLGELPQERRAGRAYRLPSEAEWEYACRGGACSTGPFAFGGSLTADQANFDGYYPYPPRRGSPHGAYLKRTCAVGSYRPNAFGLYDMHGNVWEWCADWFDPVYYAHSPRRDPPGPGRGNLRVLRGGSWQNPGDSLRSARRARNGPVAQMNLYGFRVVMEAGR